MNIPNESNLNFDVSVFLCNKEKYKIRIINENKKSYTTQFYLYPKYPLREPSLQIKRSQR